MVNKMVIKKKRYKLKWKNLIALIIFFIAFIFLIKSGINLINYFIDTNKTNDEIKEIEDVVNIEETKDNENTEIIEQKEEIPKENPYWDYIKMNLINVNFDELLKINNETKGWIQVNGTNINYPFVQTNNNDYYLTHSFNKSYNQAGWVFMDYRNNTTDYDKNTILYAHGMNNKTMFGSLRNILSSSWYDNTDNHIIKLSTPTENTLWQVFSVYHIETTNDYIQTRFTSDEEYQNFLNKLKNRSAVEFDTSINANDKILTLSTCYNKTDKVVMHAKLIKKEAKT
ncbi:putative uncharacterized protein [Mycoplasma sp. CAG:776]|nr:putative uncharacterized protein [Mycoplasma sp. CAG:776]